jgi:hypothetical protein
MGSPKSYHGACFWILYYVNHRFKNLFLIITIIIIKKRKKNKKNPYVGEKIMRQFLKQSWFVVTPVSNPALLIPDRLLHIFQDGNPGALVTLVIFCVPLCRKKSD